MKNILKKYSYPYIIWMGLFIIIPVMLIFLYSIILPSDGDPFSFKFTLDHFIRFFTAENLIYIKPLYRSLLLAGVSTLFTFILGYPLAYILSSIKPDKRNIYLLLFIIPMWTNMLLRTYSWIAILGRNGILNKILSFFNLPTLDLLNTNFSVILGMVYNFLPFMIFPIYTALVKLDKSLIDAANDLGANKFQAFIKIVFPLSLPGVISGVIMVFMPAASSFVIPVYLGGGKIDLIGNLIERQFKFTGNWNFGSALSIILMLVILLSMAIFSRYQDKNEERGGSLW